MVPLQRYTIWESKSNSFSQTRYTGITQNKNYFSGYSKCLPNHKFIKHETIKPNKL